MARLLRHLQWQTTRLYQIPVCDSLLINRFVKCAVEFCLSVVKLQLLFVTLSLTHACNTFSWLS